MATTMRELLKVDEILKQGMELGIAQGREQGREQGMELGIAQTKRELAKAFIDLLNDETIAERTGLTLQEVAKIREEHHLSQVH